MIRHFTIATDAHDQFLDITAQVQRIVTESGVAEGECCVYVPHTTAAVTIQENDDPNVVADIIEALDRLFPPKGKMPYRHFEGNAPSHLKASVMGTSTTILVQGGKLQLGRWQSIFFCEFDGPRHREVWVKVTA